MDKLNLFADLQYREINYKTAGIDSDLRTINVGANYSFFNPKVGLYYQINPSSSIYASYAIGNREPVRNDFIDASIAPKSENLHLKTSDEQRSHFANR